MWAQSYRENQSTRFLWEFSQLQIPAIQSDLKSHFEGQISRSRDCIQHFERNINSSKPEVYDLEQRGSNSPRGVLGDQRRLMDQKRDGNKNHVRSHHPLLTCYSIHVPAFEKHICGYIRSAWFLYLIGLGPDVHPMHSFGFPALALRGGHLYITVLLRQLSLTKPSSLSQVPFGSFSGTDCASVSQI